MKGNSETELVQDTTGQETRARARSAYTMKTNDGPEWVFREIVAGQWWEVGNILNPTKVKHMAGFYDFRYAILKAWRGEVSLLKLPGVSLSSGEASDRADALNSTPDKIRTENNVYVTSGPFTGFSSDNVADARTLRECRQEKSRLQDLLEIAKETRAPEEGAKIKAQMHELDSWALEYFVPGGELKRLNKGDPLEKAAGAARKRKRRAVSQLENFGLADIAEHWRARYCVHPRSFTYCPLDPRPDWVL